MTNNAAITDHRVEVGRAVHHGAVLNRGLATYSNRAVITAKHGPRPDTRLRANRHIPYDYGVGRNECLGRNRGQEVAECVDGHDQLLGRLVSRSRR